ncbi:hypothetical protein AB0873_20890 [Micromonospora sp. NPDC047707]|uniref:hypothetical protein n=1 Tax=Micromonospora sp. NPDC047707 TaxID=3154498 RepID=UPI003453D7C2
MPTLRSWGREGPLFVWRTHDGRTYYAALDGGPTATPEHSSFADSSEPLGQQTESIRAQVRASVLDSGRPLVADVQLGSRYVAAVVGLVCLAVLIAGPAPVVGTRWYWFWIGTGVPFGLGVPTWLIIERPGSRRAGASPEPGYGQPVPRPDRVPHRYCRLHRPRLPRCSSRIGLRHLADP